MRKQAESGPPQDGRAWIRSEAAAEMLGVGPNYLYQLAKANEWTVFRASGNAPCWYLRSEIDSWAEFQRMRRTWCRKYALKGRYPRYTEKIDLETARRLFIGTKEAAAMLGVSYGRIQDLVRKGRLVSYQTKPGQRGSRLWFSRRAVELLMEEPKRLEAKAAQKRGRKAQKARKGGPVYTARDVRRVEIPAGWLTQTEVARRLGVSWSTVNSLRQRGRLRGERLWRRHGWLKFWYIPEWEVERLEADEGYQRLHAAALARRGAKTKLIDKIKMGQPKIMTGEEDLTQALRPMFTSDLWQLPPEPDWADGKPSPWGV